MPVLHALAQPLWRDVTLVLLHFVWQGALIACLVRCALACLARRPASVRYLATLAGLMLMALCPLATFAGLRAARQVETNATGGLAWRQTERSDDPGPIATSSLAGAKASADSPSMRILEIGALSPTAQLSLIVAWFAGVACFGIRLTFGALWAVGMRAGCRPVKGPLQGSFENLKERLIVARLTRLLASDRAGEALVLGFIRPVVLLPAAWLSELPVSALEAILAHELAHIRRRDLWVNLLQRVLETLLFYHPAMWWLSRQARIEREKCCDELAVAATSDPLAYVRALELAARQRLSSSQPVVTAAFRGANSMTLLERVRNVLRLSPRESKLSWWPVGLAALMLPLGAWAISAGWLGGAPLGIASADDDLQEQFAHEDSPTGENEDDEFEGDADEGDDDEGDDYDAEDDEGDADEGDDEDADHDEGDDDEADDDNEGDDDQGDHDAADNNEGDDDEGDDDYEVSDDAEWDEDEDGDDDGSDELHGDEARAHEQRAERGKEMTARGRRRGAQPPGREEEDAQASELYRLVEELRRDVARLRDEVAELRNQRRTDQRRPDRRSQNREADGRREGGEGEGRDPEQVDERSGARREVERERERAEVAEQRVKALLDALDTATRERREQASAEERRALSKQRQAEFAAQRDEAVQREAVERQRDAARREAEAAERAAAEAAEEEAKQRPDANPEDGVRP